MKKSNTTTNTALVEALVYNNRFTSAKVDGEQIGITNFAEWKKLVNDLHRSAYKVYVQCENSGMLAESNSVDKTDVFNCIRAILAFIGDVNEHKLVANAESAVAIIGYSGRRGNVDAPELQFCISRLNNAKREYSNYESLNVDDESYKQNKLADMKKSIDALQEEKSQLLATADMRYKQPTKTTLNSFRLDVEHFFARVISGQLAKTLEELDAEEEARRVARNQRAKARKANKTK